jgi:hypothetical protein
MRVPILPVLFGCASILDRKYRTVVQAAQAHCALLFNPGRLFLFHFNGGNRALSGAEPASAMRSATYLLLPVAEK